MVELGTLYRLQGRYLKAGEFFEKARDIHEGAAAPDLVAHSRCLQARASLHDTLGNRREAKACLARARALMEQAGAPPAEVAGLLLKEASVLRRLENVLAVVSRARQALAIYREHKGERHPGALQAGSQLGRLLVSLCHLDEAAPLLEGLVMARREMLGEDHPDHAAAVAALALLRLVQGEPGEAEDLARRALALTTAAVGEQHLNMAARHRTLAHILKAGNRLHAAAESYEQALAIVHDVLGAEHPQAAETQFDLAEIHEATGEYREAVERVRATLDRLDQSPEDVLYEQATGFLSLARLRAHAGALDEAGALARRAVSLAEQLGGDPLLYGPALLLDARLRVQRGGVAEAGNLIDRAEQALVGVPPHHPLRMQAVMTRAGLARLVGDPGAPCACARDGGPRGAERRRALSLAARGAAFSGGTAAPVRRLRRVGKAI